MQYEAIIFTGQILKWFLTSATDACEIVHFVAGKNTPGLEAAASVSHCDCVFDLHTEYDCVGWPPLCTVWQIRPAHRWQWQSHLLYKMQRPTTRRAAERRGRAVEAGETSLRDIRIDCVSAISDEHYRLLHPFSKRGEANCAH